MSQPVVFGRRPPLVRQPPPGAPPTAPPAAQAGGLLSPDAEAFRSTLARGGGARSAFQSWSEGEARRIRFVWVLRVALMLPGLLGYVMHLPVVLALGLEAAGLAAAAWLKRARRSHRAAIVAWQEDADD